MNDTITMVRGAIAESVGVEIEEVLPEHTLFGDLELESIDLLDVFFRIEQTSGVSITADSLGRFLQGGISDEVFSDENDVLTPTGLGQLELVIPGFTSAGHAEPIRAEEILDLVTVGTLDRAVTSGATVPA